MADKLRKVFPIEVKFGDGEQPTAGKVNAIASQARNGLALIEKAVGDLWNSSGDAILSPSGSLTNALYVANLGRAVGTQKHLSPRVPDLNGASGIEKYRDTIVARDAVNGNTVNQLRFKPVGSTPFVGGDFTVNSANPAVLTTYVTTATAVNVDGEWHVTADGKLISYQPIIDAQITYKPLIVPDIDAVAQSTVIPDPNTIDATYNGLKLSFANDINNTQGYWLYLPPRRPLGASRKIATSPNETNNEVGVASPRYFFQDSTLDASTDPYYRYKFPAEIQATLDGGSNLTLPDNFMYLMDKNVGTIIDGLTFSVDTTAPHLTDGRYVVKISGTKLDEIVAADGTLITAKATQTSAAYKNRFVLVCPGTSVTRNVSSLVSKVAGHAHTGTDGSQVILHSNLLDLYNQDTVPWTPSTLRGDDHPQYLHREGTGTRDYFKNGMRGHLLMSSTDAGAGDYYNLDGDSNAIYFGDDRRSIYYDFGTDAISVKGGDLRLETAGKKIEFDSDPSTVYLDKTRMKALWEAMNMVKTYRTELTTSSNIGATTYTATVVLPTPPSGLLYYVSIAASFRLSQATGTRDYTYTLTSGLTINSSTRALQSLTGANVSGVIHGQGGTFSAGQTITCSILENSDTGTTTTIAGDLVVTVHPYVA